MPKLNLRLLGGLVASHGISSEQIVIPRRKAAALLAVLAVSPGQKRSREELAHLFWSRTGEDGARRNLRQALYVLRSTIPALLITSRDVCLASDQVEVDVVSFEDAVQDGALPSLERASQIYTGEFLLGFSLREQDFEDWRSREIERLRDLALSVFERLIERYEASGRLPDAMAIANRILAIDPVHETANLALMRLYDAEGRYGLSRRKRDHFNSLLTREYGNAAVGRDLSKQQGLRAKLVHGPAVAMFRDAPSVAILPVEGTDVLGRSLAEALTANLISEIAKSLPLPVVDHRTVRSVASRAETTRDIAEQVGARFVVASNLCQVVDRWRVAASLIDPHTGAHLTSATFHGEETDLTGLVDTFSGQIAGLMSSEIERVERRRAIAAASGALGAWESFQHGLSLLAQRSVEALKIAQSRFERAVALEPNNARAIAGLASCVTQKGVCLVGVTRDVAFPEALEVARRAHELAPDDWYVNWVLGTAYQRNEYFDLSLEAYSRAQQSQPHSGEVRGDLGNLLSFMGRPEKGLPILLETAKADQMALPRVARSYLQAGEYDAAQRWAEYAIRAAPNCSWSRIILASAFGHLGRSEDGMASLQECECIHPGRISGEFAMAPTQYLNPHEHDHVLRGIELAGWHPN